MSSMRNAVQRRNHKERAQPEERQKWGLLEKRKDYKLRAADHRKKKAKLKLLSEKARDRNPDEFSFKMMSSTVDSKGRKVADRGNEALSTDVVKLLKTQDAAYIRTMLQQVRRERQKLEERLILEEEGEARALKDGHDGKQGKHRVYVENEEEQANFDADTWFGEGKSLPASQPEFPAEWEDDESEDSEDEDEPQPKTLSAKKLKQQEEKAKRMKKFEKTRSRAQSRTAFRLQMVKKKERELVAAEEELEKQRAKMTSSIGGVNKNGVKFKVRERKR
ncbi:U3 snoRNP-associated protein-like protein Utp11 [Boeremia exigua]|uniref:U3 snoRNP-associated protein-like protein Utp11 n=1 Tax=Boeremia exigua TaxID=749465 RepID=UPI001E8CDB30|nr:U3 snoRNP-associated protein-like protein Utp11 [Boeremia exigua]KAH6642842.1 U3 snoRNP-associated protein-like protein Utp11 [Boeremia exigua]